MLTKNLKKQIDEAIASEQTSDSNKKLLIEIQNELDKASSEKEFLEIAIKLIEFISVCVTTIGSG